MAKGSQQLNVLACAAGGGGLELGLKLVIPQSRVICYVEREAFAAQRLASLMEKKCLVEAPLWSNIHTFDGKPWRGLVDILTAGYPCQPFSTAGHRRGKNDPRHLWPSLRRIIGEAEPAGLFMENVQGHISMGLDEVAGDMERLGYKVIAGLYSAAEVGAPHERKRLFILALGHAFCRSGQGRDSEATKRFEESVKKMGYPRSKGRSRSQSSKSLETEQESTFGPVTQPGCSLFPPFPWEYDKWLRIAAENPIQFPLEPRVRRMANGMASNQLRLIGNGVVPLQAAYAFCSLWSTYYASLKGC